MHGNCLQRIKEVLRQSHLSFREEYVKGYRNFFLERWQGRIEAIIFYGSCLNELTRTSTSTPDFFIISKGYRDFHRNLFHALLNWAFTPNTYSLSQGSLRGKYNVISMKDLERETSDRAKDVYNLGRLTKRVALIYSKDSFTEDKILGLLANAFYTVASKVYYLIPDSFGLDSFIKEALRISYTGERRVEADDKLDRLFASEAHSYRQIYSLCLADFTERGLLNRSLDGLYTRTIDRLSLAEGQKRLKGFIRKSRVRAKARWPKSVLTFKGWPETLIAKIERTKGIKIELSEKEKRYPLIYGWKHYFRLKKDKMIK